MDPQWTPSGPSLDAPNEREFFVGIVCKTLYESHLLNKKLKTYTFLFCRGIGRNAQLLHGIASLLKRSNGKPMGIHWASTAGPLGFHPTISETANIRLRQFSSDQTTDVVKREITSSQETAAREKGVGICCGREACVKTRPAKYRSPCAILRRRRAWRVCLRLTVYPGQARKMWPGSSGSGPCGRAASSSG